MRPCAQGADWNGQVKLGNNEFYGVNYLQSVTPHLALGGEAFWLGQQRKSGAGFAARHADAAHVATCQVATTGLVSLTYLQKVSEKVRVHRVGGAVHKASACWRGSVAQVRGVIASNVCRPTGAGVPAMHASRAEGVLACLGMPVLAWARQRGDMENVHAGALLLR